MSSSPVDYNGVNKNQIESVSGDLTRKLARPVQVYSMAVGSGEVGVAFFGAPSEGGRRDAGKCTQSDWEMEKSENFAICLKPEIY